MKSKVSSCGPAILLAAEVHLSDVLLKIYDDDAEEKNDANFEHNILGKASIKRADYVESNMLNLYIYILY